MPRSTIASVVAALGASFLSSHALAADALPDIEIRDVTVISPERAAPLEHAYVHVVYGRIVAVGTQKIKAAMTIDGKGKFLVPGLIDTHAHLGWVAGMTNAQQAAHADIVRAARDQEPSAKGR